MSRSSMVKVCLCSVTLVASLTLAQPEERACDERLFVDRSVEQLQRDMARGRLTSVSLTRAYIQRIIALDRKGPRVNSVIELNPDALEAARAADRLRRQGRILGPLHGIPVLLKDNIDTGDRMMTTAGSLGLAGAPAPRDSTVVENLRAGGAVILGKVNLSEWANFRASVSSSGWSAVGGQTNNPYGIAQNACGSSAGSGAAATANFAAVTLGTETDGSILCPSSVNGVVGIKPTVGLTSRAGVVPLSRTQDVVGPMTRSVADAAATLSVIQSRGFDGRDPATGDVPLGWRGRFTRPADLPTDYTRFLSSTGLKGARLGLTRIGLSDAPPSLQAAFEEVVATIEAAGATVVDLDAAGFEFPTPDGEFLVIAYDFREDLRAYLATRTGVPLAGGRLEDAIAFNLENAAAELQYFDQLLFELSAALAEGPDAPQDFFGGLTYSQALEIDRLAGVNGLDRALAEYHLDAVIAPTGTTAWSTDLTFGDRFTFGTSYLAAAAGYPAINVPAGMVLGLPFGITFMGTAFSEAKLITLASGFEAVTQVRKKNPPTFASTTPSDGIWGTDPQRPRRASMSELEARLKASSRPRLLPLR